jgi:hypothetical protein
MSNGTSIRFEPLENGLDYLVSAANLLAGQPKAQDLKYGILHLAAGIEVLLKARLQREHWTLILAKVDEATPAKYKSGDFISISAETALRRLRDVVGVEIGDDDIACVTAILKKRNRLLHHGLVDSTEAVASVAARALDFLLSYIDRHLIQGATPESRQVINASLAEVRDKLSDIKAFVRVRLDSISGQLDLASAILQCPVCAQETFALGDEPHCLFCLRRGDPKELAETYVETVLDESHYVAVKDAGEWPVYECPECGGDTLVRGAIVRSKAAPGASATTQWACFRCGQTWLVDELDFCTRCGRPATKAVDELTVCQACVEDFMRRE